MQRYRYWLVGFLVLILVAVGILAVNIIFVKKVNPVEYIAGVVDKLQGKPAGGSTFITSFSDEHQGYDITLNRDYLQQEIVSALELSPEQRVDVVISDVPQQIVIMDPKDPTLLTNSFSVKSDSLYTSDVAMITLHVNKEAMDRLGKTAPEIESYFKLSLLFALAEWQNRTESAADDYKLDNPQERMSRSFVEGTKTFQYLAALEDKPLFFVREAQ